METIIAANKLTSIMDIPDNMRNIQVRIVVTPYFEYGNEHALTPRVKSLLGSFKMPENCSQDYKQEIANALKEKYL